MYVTELNMKDGLRTDVVLAEEPELLSVFLVFADCVLESTHMKANCLVLLKPLGKLFPILFYALRSNFRHVNPHSQCI